MSEREWTLLRGCSTGFEDSEHGMTGVDELDDETCHTTGESSDGECSCGLESIRATTRRLNQYSRMKIPAVGEMESAMPLWQ